MTHDVHANYRADWWSPPEWISWARETMGGIDLDPCAAPEDGRWFADTNYNGTDANSARDGLTAPWRGRCYVNPPGSNSIRSVKVWWAKAMRELSWASTETVGGAVLGNSVKLCALTWCFFNCEAPRALDPSPFDLPGWLVMPERRVAFWRDGKPIKSPRNWTWFWTTCEPAPPPVASWVVETGRDNVVAAVSKPNGKIGATDGYGHAEAES